MKRSAKQSSLLRSRKQLKISKTKDDNKGKNDFKDGESDSRKPIRKDNSLDCKSKLRPRKRMNYCEEIDEVESQKSALKSIKEDDKNTIYGTTILPQSETELMGIIKECNSKLKSLKSLFLLEEYNDENNIPSKNSKDLSGSIQYPEHCIPINADIKNFNLAELAKKQYKLTGHLFDVIMMDPPWQLSSSNPTRGVAIAYETLTDNYIANMPLGCLQKDGFLFIWTINAKFSLCFSLMKKWGYKYYDDICWIKESVNGKIAKGHGFYLQHSKETCLIGIKGNPESRSRTEILEDCIFSKRRGQSQKPNEIYDMIEGLVPNGYYIEIFGRRNNLRNGWVTIGNEL